MSKEVFEMLCAMDRRRVELQIVLQCAPTLAGLKISNLLILPRELEDKARLALRYTGLMGYRLVYDKHRVIFLVFNRERLVSYLNEKEIRSFLFEYGYVSEDFGKSIRLFQKRYEAFVASRENFPHEMGIFLGYPLCDVKGFIDNRGEEFKLSGYWKVYGDATKTKKLFRLFDDVKDEMVCKISKGYSVREIVAGSIIETTQASLAG